MVHMTRYLVQADTFSSCSTLTVAGMSMGADIATVFAWLANKQGDPASIQKYVSYTHLLAPVGASAVYPLSNDLDPTGCFPGGIYYTAVPSSVSGLSGEVVERNMFFARELGLVPPHLDFTQLVLNGTFTGYVGMTTPCGQTPSDIEAILLDETLQQYAYEWWFNPPYYMHAPRAYDIVMASLVLDDPNQIYPIPPLDRSF